MLRCEDEEAKGEALRGDDDEARLRGEDSLLAAGVASDASSLRGLFGMAAPLRGEDAPERARAILAAESKGSTGTEAGAEAAVSAAAASGARLPETEAPSVTVTTGAGAPLARESSPPSGAAPASAAAFGSPTSALRCGSTVGDAAGMGEEGIASAGDAGHWLCSGAGENRPVPTVGSLPTSSEDDDAAACREPAVSQSCFVDVSHARTGAGDGALRAERDGESDGAAVDGRG